MSNERGTTSVVNILNKKKLTNYQVLSQSRAYGHTKLSLLFFYVMLYKTLLEKQQPNSSICCRRRKLTLARLQSILLFIQAFHRIVFLHMNSYIFQVISSLQQLNSNIKYQNICSTIFTQLDAYMAHMCNLNQLKTLRSGRDQVNVVIFVGQNLTSHDILSMLNSTFRQAK